MFALLFSASQFVNAQCGITGQSNFITSQEALNSLAGCEVFQGDLNITGADVTNLESLSSLVSVEGNLSIYETSISTIDPLGGLIVMAAAVAIFFIVPWLDNSKVASIRYKGIYSKVAITLFGVSFLTLGYLGTVGVTEIRKTMSVVCTIIYFAYFLLMPIYTKFETTKVVPERL